MYGYSQFRVRGEARLLASPALVRRSYMGGSASSRQNTLMVAYSTYITHRMDHERTHIQVMPCCVSDEQGNNQIFFHLLKY